MAYNPLLHPPDNSAYYMVIWKSLLGQLLGWSEEQVEQWAKRYSAYLADPDDILFHADPIYWAKTTFAPDWVWERLKPLERVELGSKLHAVFSDEHGFEFPINTDWELYQVKLEQVLSEYGASLPVKTTE